MKQMAIITVLSLITATQAFSQAAATRQGQRFPGYPGTIGPSNPRTTPYDRPARTLDKRISLILNSDFQGQSTIKLKQELKFQNPYVKIQDLDLVGVQLIAKSQVGRGEATLHVGQYESYPVTIAGNPYEYQNPVYYTFDKKTIFNPSRDSDGNWQIELRGNLKVKGVVLLVKDKAFTARPEQETIYMRGEEFQGTSTIKLKQLMNQNNPRLDLSQAEIISVTIMAKSKFGEGQANLKVGPSETYPTTIPGTPIAFNSSAPRSYTPITMDNNIRGSQGVWQVELKGNIKVDQIIVTYKDQDSFPGSFPPGRNVRGRR